MTTDQAVRLQCLELAVKAGTPWSRLTEMADKLTAYVKGVSTAPAVEVQNTSTFAAVGAEPNQPSWPADWAELVSQPVTTDEVKASWLRAKRQEAQQMQESAKGVAIEEDTSRPVIPDPMIDPKGYRDITSWKPDPTAGSMTVEPDRGVAIEDEPPLRINLRNCPDCGAGEGLLHAKGCKTLAEMNAVDSWGNQRGVAVEDPDPVATARAIVAQHDARIAAEKADYPVASPYAEQPKIEPAGAANDPRLPVVTM